MAEFPLFNPWAVPIFPRPKYEDFRRSDNIEDRRKEMFNSHPQAPQDPNVFWDKLMGPQNMSQLNWRTDFVPQPEQPTALSNEAGAGLLDGLIRKYFVDLANRTGGEVGK